MCVCLMSDLKRLCLTQGHKGLLLHFKNFIVLVHSSRPTIHFEFIFVHGLRWDWISFFCLWYPLFPTTFTTENILSPLSIFISLVKYYLTMYDAGVYFWTVYFVPLVNVSTFMPVSYCSNYSKNQEV